MISRRRALALTAASLATPVAAAESDRWQAMLDYVQGQQTTGFLVIRDRKVLVERAWPAPPNAPPGFRAMARYGTNAEGALLEDVASQQKSFVSVLAQIAVDRGLLDVSRPVSGYIGAGWSKAAADQEAKIHVLDVLTMSSGLNETFGYAAPPATVFLYNTPVYAVMKRVVPAAAKQSLEAITRDWLTVPLGMKDTAWRERPAALADVGNPTGLVTSPRDVGRFGQMVLDGGRARGHVHPLADQSGVWAPLVAERQRLRDPPPGSAGGRPLDTRGARRPGGGAGRARPQALCGPQP